MLSIISCSMIAMVFVTTPLDVSAAYVAISERVAGEYYGVAIIRCSFVPKNTTIQFVEWREGKTISGDILYFNDFQNEMRYGKFKHRNVTGKLAQHGSSYDLIIYPALPGDDQYYFCRIKPKASHSIIGAPVKLTLVAPPDSPPVITDMYGVKRMTSNCSSWTDMPVARVQGEQSYSCRVGGSYPFPEVAWQHRNNINSSSLQYGNASTVNIISISRQYKIKGILVRTAEQQIHLTSIKNISLVCTITAPDASSGKSKQTRRCFQLVGVAKVSSRSDTSAGTQRSRLLLVHLCSPVILSMILLVLRCRYGKLRKACQVTFYMSMVKVFLAITFSHMCIGIVVVVHSFLVCNLGSAIDEADGMFTRTSNVHHVHVMKSATSIVVIIYLTIRLLLNVVCMCVSIRRGMYCTSDVYLHHKVSSMAASLFCGVPGVILLQMVKRKQSTASNQQDFTEMALIKGDRMTNHRYAERTPTLAVLFPATFIFETTLSGLYLAGFLWSYVAVLCHWNDTPRVFLMCLVHLSCFTWACVAYVCIFYLSDAGGFNKNPPAAFYGSDEVKDFDPWPPTRAAYNMGPVTVQIEDCAVEGDMLELVKLASALASSKCKGYICIHHKTRQGVPAKKFDKWKNKIISMLKHLLGENPGDLFKFSENSAEDDHFFLHVIPANTPLLVPHTFTNYLQVAMPETKKELIDKMKEMSDNYTCYVLNNQGEPVVLARAKLIERMEKIIKLMEVKKIPGFLDDEMKKYSRIQTPNAECAVFSMYGVEDMIQVRSGLQMWPQKPEERLGLEKETCKNLACLLSHLQEYYAGINGLLYISPCIKNDVDKTSQKREKNIICDVLIITSRDMPVLLTLTFANADIRGYRDSVRCYLDQSLSYTQSTCSDRAFYVEHHIITAAILTKTNWFHEIITGMHKNKMYPKSYLQTGDEKCKSITYSLYTSLASFVPSAYVVDKEGMDFVQTMNLMTVKQLNTLLACQSEESQSVLLTGFAGSGKTVVALEYAKWLRSDRAEKNEILYVAYSKVLAERIRGICLPWCHPKAPESLCLATTICDLLMCTELPVEFRDVKWWILDDVQNYVFVEKRKVPPKRQSENIFTSNVGTTSQITESACSAAVSLPHSTMLTTTNRTSVTSDGSLSLAPDGPTSATSDGPTSSVSDGSAEVLFQSPLPTKKKPETTGTSLNGHDPIKEQKHPKSKIFKKKAPPSHWLANLQFLTTGSTLEKILVLCSPTQALGKNGQREMDFIKDIVAFDKILNLEQVSRSSIEITKFIVTDLVPNGKVRDIGWDVKNIEDNVAHQYTGKTPEICRDCSDGYEDLKERISQWQHERVHQLKEGDWGIIIDKSAVKADNVACNQADINAETDAEWGLIDDYIGIEKPIIMAIMGSNAHWSQKVAIASRARVDLHWIELQEPISSNELANIVDSKNMPYIEWVKSDQLSKKTTIAVFGGTRSGTDNIVDRVIAAPLTYLGLQDKYTQVESVPTIPNPRFDTAVVAHKGEVWMVGGLDAGCQVTGVCDVLDLATCHWGEGPSLMTGRYLHTVTVMPDGIVTVGGRDADTKDLSSCEILKLGRSWQHGPNLPGKRSGHAACEWNGLLYVSGGLHDRVCTSVISWKPLEDNWKREASLIVGRGCHTMAVCGEMLVVCGGSNDFDIEEYNSVSQTWSKLTQLPEKNYGTAIVAYEHALYTVGGMMSNSTWRYDGNWDEEDEKLPWQIHNAAVCIVDFP